MVQPDQPYAMLLAAGLSTRLGELSRQRPKPLMPVCDHSLLRWTAAMCVHAGIRELIVNLHHLGGQIRAELGNGTEVGARVRYSPEETILGTGGGIRQMAARMERGATCVVLNAKTVFADLDLQQVLAFHRQQGALATLVVRPHRAAARWGAIGVDGSGRVRQILEHLGPGAVAGEATPYQFTGIHVLEPEFIAAIPAEGAPCVIRSAYRELLEAGAPIAGFVHQGYFYDHSTPPRYLQGNLNLLTGAAAPAHRPGPLRGVDATARVDPSAGVVEPVLVGPGAFVGAGARVGPNVVVGRRAAVAAGVVLRECVVWPDARVEASAQRAVITPLGPVAVPAVDDPEAAPR